MLCQGTILLNEQTHINAILLYIIQHPAHTHIIYLLFLKSIHYITTAFLHKKT